mmetsp:Transcript_30044/g.41255  ORF Transcript_30044/g.41255 Transcript_30044/m.41255 type:complete len:344 (-) Transcript_30044:42-1073(-)
MILYSSEIRLAVYTVAIYAIFIYWAYLQEKIVSTDYPVVHDGDGPLALKWHFPFALNISMAIVCHLTAAGIIFCFPSMSSKVSPVVFWKSAISGALASPIGYQALKYITYPMMVLTKSSKPVPVMFVGIFFYQRKYKWYKYVGVAMVCIGIAMFTLYKSSGKYSAKVEIITQPSINLIFGILLVLINLSLDGYTNNEQDHLFSKYTITSLDMMKYVNLWQAVYIFFFLIGGWLLFGSQSEASNALILLQHCPAARFDLLMFCISTAVGQILLFTLIKEFGSLLWVTISVTRKLFTVLASVFIFEHSVNVYQWFGVFLVFAGLFLEIVMTHIQPHEEKKALKKE